MRIFVAGGTGAVGKPLVRQLKESGHEPTVLTRSGEAARLLVSRGTNAIVGDALNRAEIADALARSRPDVVVNELTNIPRKIDFRNIGKQFATTNALRTQGTANLIAAALDAGVRQFISQSVAFFYAPGPGLATEKDELLSANFSPLCEMLEAVASCERSTLSNPAIVGTVLRYGGLYGPGTQYDQDEQLDQLVKRRGYPIVGAGDGGVSLVHVEDAASAVIHSIAAEAPGIYNVVDDDPVTVKEFVRTYASRHSAPTPIRVPTWLARAIVGRYGVFFMTQLRAASNMKIKTDIKFTFRYPTWRTAI